MTPDRRQFVCGLLGSLASTSLADSSWAANEHPMGPARPFSYDELTERAKTLAGQPFKEPYRPAPDIVSNIDYATHGKIVFKPEQALNVNGPGVYPVEFFHLGKYFPKKVSINLISEGMSQEVLFSPEYFDIPKDSIAHGLPQDAGFAGFRFHESRRRKDWKHQDWMVFLGASYFRSIGSLNQYGLSARGIAVDVAVPEKPEEFPDFVEFYIDSAKKEGDPNLVYALLDGPSVSGAFKFAITRTDGAVMDVEARLFARKKITQLGIAPLTSMFWYGEYNRLRLVDWRPEVHDSDGIALWTGKGERIWRPLNNPKHVVTSSFQDSNPQGFGLLQRDRNIENYLDGVNYDRRPSLWVQPLHDWGKGAVQLIEIPTADETHDNIVAFWMPEKPIEPGTAFDFRYRLFWRESEPFPNDQLASVFATRIGRGGEPGQEHTSHPSSVKFVVEFEGGALKGLTTEAPPQGTASCSRGKLTEVVVEPIPRTERWRARFDLVAEGNEPIELRLFLHLGEQAFSETWAFQFWPDQATAG
ncbi:glucan biosynthesis protein [Terrihabitans sp. B22-R8]|uniref:glucan biosynthesis protein n=1 Tax=Terrihabitans sp. B22-R8 TaxID=3425128 RepID=UPI00403C778D